MQNFQAISSWIHFQVKYLSIRFGQNMVSKNFGLVHCRKLYWTDSYYGSVHVMELNGSYQKRLLSGHFSEGNSTYVISRPRALAVNPKYG